GARVERLDVFDVDPGTTQALGSAGRLRVRVVRAVDDALDAGGEDRVDAGRRRPVVVAGLERHVERRAARPLAGLVEDDALRVPPARLRRAFRHHLAV